MQGKEETGSCEIEPYDGGSDSEGPSFWRQGNQTDEGSNQAKAGGNRSENTFRAALGACRIHVIHRVVGGVGVQVTVGRGIELGDAVGAG